MKGFRKYLFTGSVVLFAAVAVFFRYRHYVNNPWTRNGQVSANVVEITPRVSGPVVSLCVKDNEYVEAGDLLFRIDPRTFEAALDEASAQYDIARDNYQAQLKEIREASSAVEAAKNVVLRAKSTIKQLDSEIRKNEAELERQKELLPQKATSQRSMDWAKASYDISVERRKGAVSALAQAEASLDQSEAALGKARAKLGQTGDANASIRAAQAALEQARLNLEFTLVRASVDGYVTNLNVSLGTHAVANEPALALVDVNSFRVYGFFKETSISRISKGDRAIVTLMAYPDKPIEGYVDSLGWGIAQDDGSTGFELLPNVSPTFEWIRLAQRVPVRVHFDQVPEDVELRIGTTASVLIKAGSSDAERAD